MHGRKQKQPKSFWQRIFYSQIIIFAGIFFIVIFSVGTSKRMARKKQIHKETEELQAEIGKLEANSNDLNELLAYLNSNEFIEEEARTKLGLKKDGEQIVIINDNNKTENVKKVNDLSKIYRPATSREKSNQEKWRDYFFKVK